MAQPHAEGDVQTTAFYWPDGIKAAVSFTFDDARRSQIRTGIPLLDKYSIRGTFYVSPHNVRADLGEWRNAAGRGHEIGNHTNTHPCSRGMWENQDVWLEGYTLECIEADIRAADAVLETFFGRRPVSFAYPCGQTFIGEGETRRSYKPVVLRHFMTGRGFPQTRHNDPATLKPEYLLSMSLDNLPPERAVAAVEMAAAEGGWLVFTGHEIGDGSVRQTVDTAALEALLRFGEDRKDILFAPVEEIAAHVIGSRPSV